MVFSMMIATRFNIRGEPAAAIADFFHQFFLYGGFVYIAIMLLQWGISGFGWSVLGILFFCLVFSNYWFKLEPGEHRSLQKNPRDRPMTYASQKRILPLLASIVVATIAVLS